MCPIRTELGYFQGTTIQCSTQNWLNYSVVLLEMLLTRKSLILTDIIFERPLQIDSGFSITRIYSLLKV